ncbi:MAG: hypothetical protein JO060_05235 [Candidatus Eremiobacteraeota bacterium]|nr:hypothetical protein [Candidatus Eremiobacteraeota bacterium]
MITNAAVAKRIVVDFTVVDNYLLGQGPTKERAVAALLAERSPLPQAAAFYRALEAVGVRAADEALIALRLVLSGQTASDERVLRVRGLSATARAAAEANGRKLATVRKRDGSALTDLPWDGTPSALCEAARAAYHVELS